MSALGRDFQRGLARLIIFLRGVGSGVGGGGTGSGREELMPANSEWVCGGTEVKMGMGRDANTTNRFLHGSRL